MIKKWVQTDANEHELQDALGSVLGRIQVQDATTYSADDETAPLYEYAVEFTDKYGQQHGGYFGASLSVAKEYVEQNASEFLA